MRTVSFLALAFLGGVALGEIHVALIPCGQLSFGDCENRLPEDILLALLGLCGFVLALIASILGIVRTVKRHQWSWLVGLVVGVLAPLPAGVALSALADQVYNQGPSQAYYQVYGYPVQTILPLSAGLLLTPVTALVYSLRSRRGAAPDSLTSS